MKNRFISIITCVNNDTTYKRMKEYMGNATIPEGYEIEYIDIRDARNMCEGYNRGMVEAQGDIKIYMHQDVYILNDNLLQVLVDLFKDSSIGVVGFAGAKNIPTSGKYSSSKDKCGYIKHYMSPGYLEEWRFGSFDKRYEEVDCVDGLFMATQYDISWREDILKHWHFYDIAQCIEFRRAGYKVIVPSSYTPWCLHDCGKSEYRRYKGYDVQREIFIKEYKDYLRD